MASFFGAIQNWFKGDFYGRHLGLILQEVGTRRPEAVTSFVSDVFGIPRRTLRNARFQAEYSFVGQRGWRRADLAIFIEDEDEPVILVEIKYHDKPLPETNLKPAQLADYKTWREADSSKRHVLLLTRELYRADGIEVRRWDALTHHLRRYSERSQSDLVDMLVSYLEEEGNAMQKIDGHALTRYLKRFVCDRTSGANNFSGPIEFSNLLKNMQLISGFFHGHFKAAWKNAGEKGEGDNGARKVATIDFRVFPRVKPATRGGLLVDDEGMIVVDRMNGGQILVFARHSLGGGSKWLRVNYGILLDISPGDRNTNPPKTYLFAEILGPGLMVVEKRVWIQRPVNYASVTDDADRTSGKIESKLNSIILDAIDQTLTAELISVPKQKTAISMLRDSLASGEQPLFSPASSV
ncbi:hypothetical protein SBC1_14640 [Caballeronia sp. SBC1]|uniref:hypothetical protein n=1 Tax=unclassified Caballeronia TaxID=2646786 RepID=UPI0013E1968E|nr:MULTISPECIES: hypothetical protein [unclassified Caballeronia]QIE23578.1 hypothetical protein SBC2_16040 [Caballeronia sp. SBC2]QIN61472.1 hypothetical protein SBC1_14640 [Caballeronia sp. SBC1]